MNRPSSLRAKVADGMAALPKLARDMLSDVAGRNEADRPAPPATLADCNERVDRISRALSE